MFEKVVVGVDLSPAQDALLSCLPDLLRWGTCDILLVHVVRVGYAQGAGYGHQDEYKAWLEERAGPLRASGLTVETAIETSGDVAGTLLETVTRAEANLLVIGSRSHSIAHGLFVGSVAKEVLRRSAGPVLLQRLEPTATATADVCTAVCARALDHVLLATDFSAGSAAAEATAVAFAPQAERVDCLTVIADLADAPDHIATDEAEEKLETLVHAIEQGGGTTRAYVERGEPGSVIARVGGQGYTLIVLGRHGRGWVRDTLLGRTAEKVCEIALRPVLLVP